MTVWEIYSEESQNWGVLQTPQTLLLTLPGKYQLSKLFVTFEWLSNNMRSWSIKVAS